MSKSETKHPVNAALDAAKAKDQQNVVDAILGGKPTISTKVPHKQKAKISNLFFEYLANTNWAQRALPDGTRLDAMQIARYFESQGLMTIDSAGENYLWKGAPVRKADFLRMLSDAEQQAEAVGY